MFEEDNPKGLKGEDITERYLYERQKAITVFRMQGYYPEWDMIAVMEKGKLKTIETKTDIMENQTGNIAIEYMNRGKLSGILVSQADWYVIVLKAKLLCMKRRDLFYFLRENSFKEIKGMGDFSTIILVPTDELIAAGFCDVWNYNKITTSTNRNLE